MPTFVKRSEMPVPRERLFEYHARPGALQRLLPPFQAASVLDPGGIHDGERVVLAMGPRPVAQKWVAVHRDYRGGHSFTDEQESGPFASWSHTHLCLDAAENAAHSILEDRLEYALPLGAAGRLFGGRIAARTIDRVFRFRHERTRDDLSQSTSFGGSPLRVAISGATGLVGQALEGFLLVAGHQVIRIGRRPRTGSDDVGWDPAVGRLDAAALEGVDAVVHLAGESISGLRWTAAKKRAIRESRVVGTRLIAEACSKLATPPKTLISASAIGFYGDRAEAEVDESSPQGEGFLADVCRDWESATAAAGQGATRVVHLRIGVVMSAAGGALAAQLPLFKAGLGGALGHGRQGLSWIGLDDLVYAIHFLLQRDDIDGVVNATTTGAVSNREFARTLGRVLGRPAVLPVPSIVLRAALGEMADEMMLGGSFVVPGVLERAGFRFTRPDLESALAFELGRAPGRVGH